MTQACLDCRESVGSWDYPGFQDHQDYLVPLVKRVKKAIVAPRELAWKVPSAPVDLQDLRARLAWATQGGRASGDPRVARDRQDLAGHQERRDLPATVRCATTETPTSSTCCA